MSPTTAIEKVTLKQILSSCSKNVPLPSAIATGKGVPIYEKETWGRFFLKD